MAYNDLQDSPFRNLLVDTLVHGGTVVSWTLEPTFGAPDPWSFELQWSRSGSDSWTTVTTVTDAYTATDSTRRDYSSILEGFYRVVLTDNGGTTYESAPSNFPSTWGVRDLQIVGEIRRKERLLAEKQTGVACWILARKFWGTDCTDCVDETTEEVQNPRCSTCYGTGYVGGYHNPHPDFCRLMGSKDQIVEQMGTTIYSQMRVRMAPIPLVAEHDVIILEGSDRRLEVIDTAPKYERKGRTIVQDLTLQALDPDDVIYDLRWSGSKDPEDGEQDTW